METIAWKFVREELRITPAKVERIQYMQEVLACPVCREEDTGTIVKAPVPTALLAHIPASPSMAALTTEGSEIYRFRILLFFPFLCGSGKLYHHPCPADPFIICILQKYLGLMPHFPVQDLFLFRDPST